MSHIDFPDVLSSNSSSSSSSSSSLKIADGTVHKSHCALVKAQLQIRELEDKKNNKKRKSAPDDSEKKTVSKKKKVTPVRAETTYKFGNQEFTSLKQVLDFCKDILEGDAQEYYPNDPTFEILRDIIKRCDAYKDINFVSIGHKKHDKGKASSFYFTTPSEQTISFQYREFLKTAPPQIQVQPEYRIAFTNAVKQQVMKFRTHWFKNVNKDASKYTKKNTEVQYVGASFDDLVDAFLQQEDMKVSTIPRDTFGGSTNPKQVNIINANLRAKWIAYHEKNATLNVVLKAKTRTPKEKKSAPAKIKEVKESEPVQTSSPISSSILAETAKFTESLKLPVAPNFLLKAFPNVPKQQQ